MAEAARVPLAAEESGRGLDNDIGEENGGENVRRRFGEGLVCCSTRVMWVHEPFGRNAVDDIAPGASYAGHCRACHILKRPPGPNDWSFRAKGFERSQIVSLRIKAPRVLAEVIGARQQFHYSI